MPTCKLQYIKPRDWACSTNDLGCGGEFELCTEKVKKGGEKRLSILVMSYITCVNFGGYYCVRMLLAIK